MSGHRDGNDDLQGAECGATLLELLIYLSLASLILLTANEGLQLTRNLAARAVAIAGRGSALEVRLLHLRNLFSASAEAGDTPTGLAGSTDAVTFGTSAAVRALRTTTGPEGVRLERISPDGTAAVIVDRAVSIVFAFRSLRPKDTGWLSRWSAADIRPQLVRITIRPQALGEPVETVLSLEPPVDQPCLDGGTCSLVPKEQTP